MENIDWSTAGKRICNHGGHIQLRKTIKGKHYSIMEHVWVWENINGKKPDGYQIHHIDENPTNNTIENLMLLSPLEHTRIHSGEYRIISGIWWKRCNACEEYKMLQDEFYKNAQHLYGTSLCKKCDNIKSRKYHDEQLKINNAEYIQKRKDSCKKYRLNHKGDTDYLLRKKEAQKRYLLKKKESKGENNGKGL